MAYLPGLYGMLMVPLFPCAKDRWEEIITAGLQVHALENSSGGLNACFIPGYPVTLGD